MRDVRRRHAGEEVRGAGPARDEAHARHVGHAPKAVRHERRGLLVAHVDVLDGAVVVERVEHVQERGADDAEPVLHALGLEELDDGAAAVHHFAWTTRFFCVPSRVMPISTTSPGWRYRGGFIPCATPAGVPVEIRSPARSDMKWLT